MHVVRKDNTHLFELLVTETELTIQWARDRLCCHHQEDTVMTMDFPAVLSAPGNSFVLHWDSFTIS